jgi:hypothetical protein
MAALPPRKGCESLKLIEILAKSNEIITPQADKSMAYAHVKGAGFSPTWIKQIACGL